MSFHKNLITLSHFFSADTCSICQYSETGSTQLETIQLQAHPLVQTAAEFAVADHVIDQKTVGRAQYHHW